MQVVNLKFKTITPIIIELEDILVAYNEAKFYFINICKLEFVLSLLGKLQIFRDYISTQRENNITQWLRKNNLLYDEMLNEISFEKVSCESVSSEAGCSLDGFSVINTKIFERALLKFFLQNFNNIVLYDYIQENFEKFNEYIEDILLSLSQKNNNKMSFSDFVNSVLEIDRIKIRQHMQKFNETDINVEIILNDGCSNFATIEKLVQNNKNYYKLCIRENILLSLNLRIELDFLHKYLQICEFVNKKRVKEDFSFVIDKIVASQRKSYVDSKIALENNLIESNFSFLSFEQIFYYCLSEKNRTLLNRVFFSNTNSDITSYLFSFRQIKDKGSKFINYAKVEFQSL